MSLDVAHPLIARRAWLWRAETGEVIEALGFAAPGGSPGRRTRPSGAGSPTLSGGPLQEYRVGAAADAPWLAWAGRRAFTERGAAGARRGGALLPPRRSPRSRRAPRLQATLEAYLGRRSAAQALAAPLRRVVGETIAAALLFADLRGFTEMSERAPPEQVIAALDAWFDRIAGAVHAFGGEVLKFIGDGVLAIFPVVEGSPEPACAAALNAVVAARAGHGEAQRAARRRRRSAAARSAPRCISAKSSGATSAPPTGSTSPPSAPRSIW